MLLVVCTGLLCKSRGDGQGGTRTENSYEAELGEGGHPWEVRQASVHRNCKYITKPVTYLLLSQIAKQT